jgi:predicted nucleotidyltransferase
MDEKMLNTIIGHRELFVPSLFTSKQVDILHKYTHKEILNNTEKAYLYSTIKRKIDALNILREEFYVLGEEMIPERVEQAKQILKEINQPKAFISGSFLFSKKYHDIDIYVVGKRRKSYHRENKHFTHIREKDMQNPLFISAANYSIATFKPQTKPLIKREAFGEIFFTYQWVINQILDKEDQKEIRNLVFQYYLQVQKQILDARKLDIKLKEIKALPDDKKIEEVNRITKEILLTTFSKKYLYNALSIESNAIKKMSLEYKTNDNLLIYIKCLEEVKNECRRAEA